MTGSHLAAAYDRVAAHLAGRERELTLVLAAVAAGRDIILEGPPGTSKSTLLRAITAEWGIPLVFVEGNADLQDAELARELARLGHGRLRLIGGYTDVAPALGAIFTH